MPAQDWTGQAITAATCARCAQAALRAQGGCEPAPQLCAGRLCAPHRPLLPPAPGAGQCDHLAHPYFEVRAIAARYADLFRLGPLLRDADETVRLQVALRVPQRQLLQLCRDPHREVRIRVALRLADGALPDMLADADYQVRQIVAQRINPALLPRLMHDSDRQVRLAVARRLHMPALWRMVQDPAPEVRRLLAQRLPVALLAPLAGTVTGWCAGKWPAGPRRLQPRWPAEAEVLVAGGERLA